MTILNLTKHHGLGNDFLVLLDPEALTEVTAAMATALCDRRVGIGADGLLHVRKGGDGADLELTVWNADGSVAETSGNGLRCMAQAAVDGGIASQEMLVRTGGAIRHLRVAPESAPGVRQVDAGMGSVDLGAEETGLLEELGSSRARRADTGNPHVVWQVDEQPSLRWLEVASRDMPGGPVNAEAITVVAPDHLRMWVWERGAGETRACGSGSVASAAVARSWGLVGDTVRVTNPGGDLIVQLGPNNEATLTGPAKFIGRIEVDPDRISS
jgi:diaminopimelate epimerase